MIILSSKNVKRAHEEYFKLLQNEDWKQNIFLKGLEKTHEFNKNLWENNTEWDEKQRKILAENGMRTIHFAQEAQDWLWKNDPEWAEKMSNILYKNILIANKYLDEHPEIRIKAIKKSKEK